MALPAPRWLCCPRFFRNEHFINCQLFYLLNKWPFFSQFGNLAGIFVQVDEHSDYCTCFEIDMAKKTVIKQALTAIFLRRKI